MNHALFACFRRVAAVGVCVALAWVPPARADEALRYELTPDFEKGCLHVELSWQAGERRQSALQVSERVGPIADVPGMLRNMRFGSVVRRQGGVWILKHRPGETLQVAYDVAPRRREFDDWGYTHCPITTTEFFHGLGNAFLLAPTPGPETPDEFEVVLRWKLPAGFKAVCSWGSGRHIGARIKATDLRHSVYLAGRLKTATSDEHGRKVTVAIVDRFGFSPEEFLKMTTTIIQCQCEFMLEDDFPEFVVTAIPVGGRLKAGDSRIVGSGLYNSLALFVAPEARLDDTVEHLFAHELFHHWNGKLLQAQQPERLVYWFTEGFTDYYSLRILYESGHWDAETYATWINRHIREYYVNPAMNASNEEIDRDYWNKRNTVGEVAYQRGLLLGLRWHKLARKNGVSDGVDRLFKSLVNRGRSGGYQVSNRAIRQAGVELLGPWFATEFDRYVTRAETIDVPPDALMPGLLGELTEVHGYELGFDQSRSLEDRKVRGLLSGSAAEKAGLHEGDRLLGWSISNDPDKLTKLKVQRGDQALTISYYARGQKRMVMQFRPAD